MVDTVAFINVLNQDYETREHCNEDSHLLIEEPTKRSQEVKRIIGVRHQEVDWIRDLAIPVRRTL